MSTQDSKVDVRDAHLNDIILTEPAHLDSFRLHRHLDKRAQVRRRVEPEAREVAKLAEPELVEQRCVWRILSSLLYTNLTYAARILFPTPIRRHQLKVHGADAFLQRANATASGAA